MARYQAPTIRELSDRGILSRADSVALTEAREFLWRVRALLHVHAGAPQEILTFDEQVWLAQHFGYRDQPHLLAVEQFMQQYYQHTMGLHERCIRFVERCRSIPFWQRMSRFLPVPRVDEYFVVRGSLLSVADEHRNRVLDGGSVTASIYMADKLARTRVFLAGDGRAEPDRLEHYWDTLELFAGRRPELPFLAELAAELPQLEPAERTG